MEYCNQYESENLKKENLELSEIQRKFIKDLLIKNSLLLCDLGKQQLYQGNKFSFTIYEDDYKFLIDIINIETFKIDKFYGNHTEEQKRTMKIYTATTLDSIYTRFF